MGCDFSSESTKDSESIIKKLPYGRCHGCKSLILFSSLSHELFCDVHCMHRFINECKQVCSRCGSVQNYHGHCSSCKRITKSLTRDQRARLSYQRLCTICGKITVDQRKTCLPGSCKTVPSNSQRSPTSSNYQSTMKEEKKRYKYKVKCKNCRTTKTLSFTFDKKQTRIQFWCTHCLKYCTVYTND